MGKWFFILLTLLPFAGLRAQDWEWVKLREDNFTIVNSNFTIDDSGDLYESGIGSEKSEPFGFIKKYNPLGETLWIKFSTNGIHNFNFSYYEGNYYLYGTAHKQFTFEQIDITPAKDTVGFILKLDENFNVIWQSLIDGNSGFHKLLFYKQQIWICGTISGTGTLFGDNYFGKVRNLFISSIDINNGSKISNWTYDEFYFAGLALNGNHLYLSFRKDFLLNPNRYFNNHYLQGEERSNFIVKLNFDGEIIWLNELSNNNGSYYWPSHTLLAVDSNDNFFTWKHYPGKYGMKGWLQNFADNSTSYTWSYSGDLDCSYPKADIYNFPEIIVAGKEGEIPYGEGSEKWGKGVLISFHENGKINWKLEVEEASFSFIRGRKGEFYIFGGFRLDTLTLGKHTLIQINFRKRFLAKLTTPEYEPIIGLSFENFKSTTPLTLHPNPTSSHFTLTFAAEKAEVTITDFSGKVMLNRQVLSGENISIDGFSKGMYFVQVRIGGDVVRRKLVVD